MRKKNESKKVFPVSVGLTATDIELLEDIYKHTSFLSISEVVRDAIRVYHKSVRPAYIFNRSVKDRTKREELENEKKFDDMTDLEYAQTFKPLILPNRKNELYAIFLGLGTSLQILPVTNMKKWKDQEAFIAISEGHLADYNDSSPNEILHRLHMGGWVNNFNTDFDIDLRTYLDANPIKD